MFFLFIINFSHLILLKLLLFHKYHQKKLIQIHKNGRYNLTLKEVKLSVVVWQVLEKQAAELFGVARSTVSEVKTAFEKEGKTSSLKQNSGKKRKLSIRDRRTLTRIVRKAHKNTAPKITAELNDHLEKPIP